MAIAGVGGDASRASRTSGLIDYNLAYTKMGWFIITTDSNNFAHFMALERDDNNYDVLGTDNDGTTLRLSTEVGGSSTVDLGTNISINTWYHLAIVRQSATVLEAYLNGVLDCSCTHGTVVSRAASTQQTLLTIFAFSVFSIVGRVAAMKEYSAALTPAEIVQESRQYLPVRTENLGSWHPLLTDTQMQDLSGLGFGYTDNGVNTADGPPVPWKRGRRKQVYIPPSLNIVAIANHYNKHRRQSPYGIFR